MKRVISVILTLSMLLSIVAVAPVFSSSAAEAEYEHTLADYNVGAKAYKFDGTVIWSYFSGQGSRSTLPYFWTKDHPKSPLAPETVKEGTSGDVLTIDGVIEDGEWGAPSVSISSKDAVTVEVDKKDYSYLYPNAENTFFSYTNDTYGLAVKDGVVGDENYNVVYEGLSYDVYFMWDTDYLYVAARVYDPDGHSNKAVPAADTDGHNISLENTWNGDAFQFRIDGEGPNSVSDGGNYDASQASPAAPTFPETGVTEGSRLEDGAWPGDMDPLSLEKYTDEIHTYPWASSYKMFRKEMKTDVCNFAVAYSTAKNGFTAVHDAAKRYNPHDMEHKDNDLILMTYTAYDGCSLSFYNSKAYGTPIWVLMRRGEQDRVYATVTPQGTGWELDPSTGKGANTYNHATTDYEIALPWSYVNLQSGAEIAPGLELGVALGLLNATGGGEYNSTLEWGNGIFSSRMSYMPQTCGGSNSLILSETSYKDHEACEHEFAAPTCEDPYKCIHCGYEKGYKAGHKYVTYEQVLPTESKAGYTKAKCSTCGDEVTRELANTYANTFRKFERTETTHENIYENFSVGYSTLWLIREYKVNAETGEIEVVQTTDSQGNTVDKGEQIRTVEDNKIKMSFWAAGAKKPYCTLTTDDSDLITNPFGFAVLDCTSIDQTGSYFLNSTGSPSYTYKTDIYLEGVYDVDWPDSRVESLTDINYGNSGYLDQMFFWFGGVNETDYQAGLYKIKGNWYFAIIKNSSKMDRSLINEDMVNDIPTGQDGLQLFKDQAIVCVPATEEQVKFGAWHEMVFFFDKDANVASLYWDDQLVVGAYDEGFTSEKTGNEGNCMLRPFNIQFYMTDIDIGTTTIASRYITETTPTPPPVEEKYEVTVNGEVIGEYEEGETVTITAEVADGYTFDGWTGDVAFADATATTTTFTMPANAVAVEYTTTKVVVKYNVIVNTEVVGQYEAGETVTITAPVHEGYQFVQWGCAPGESVEFADATSATTTFVMPNYDVRLTAFTEAIKYNVYVNGELYTTSIAGADVPVTAEVADGYTFDGWTSATGVEFADASAVSTHFLMPTGDVYVEYTTTKAPVEGDVNGDGSCNVADVFALKAALIGRSDITDAYDINGDGKVNLRDMYALKALLLS